MTVRHVDDTLPDRLVHSDWCIVMPALKYLF